jgi:hypothetical protein
MALNPINPMGVEVVYLTGLNLLNRLIIQKTEMYTSKFTLEPYKGMRSRYKCPQCGRSHKFTRYINKETGDYIGDNVGRCDRENSCGYHFKPSEFFQHSPGTDYYKPKVKEPERPVNYLPFHLVNDTMREYSKNNFFLFLKSKFGEEEAFLLCKKYNIGTSKHWKGGTIFWQIDIKGRSRQCKIMLYNFDSGKRIKSETQAFRWDEVVNKYREDIGGNDKVYFAGRRLLRDIVSEPNLRQCFFGEHLLNIKGKIALVESEKTAIIASHFFPDFIWLATGGSNGARFTDPEVCKVFRSRDIVFFPDLGQFTNWQEKANKIQKVIQCKIIVSDLLEQNANDLQRSQGWDLADYLLFEESKGNNGIIPESLMWKPIEGIEEF